jgi:hypothetical protein
VIPPIFYMSVDDLIHTHHSRQAMYVGTMQKRLFEHERDSDTALYVVISDFNEEGALRAARVLASSYTVVADKDEIELATRKLHTLANITMRYANQKTGCEIVRAFVGVDKNLVWPEASIDYAEHSGHEWVLVTHFE